jgi:DHA1 family tetracycline resistance protein-like MFS transporter
LLNFRLFFGLAFTLFQTIFTLFVLARLGLDARSTSFVFTYVGIVIALVQGAGIGRLTRRWSDKQLLFAGTIGLSLSLLAWAFTPSVWFLLLVLIPIAVSGGILGVVSNSALTKSVYPEETGGALGLSAALDSLARVVAPIAGGFLIDRLGTPAPGMLGAAIMGGLIIFVWRRILPVPDQACPVPAEGDVSRAVAHGTGDA